MIKFVAVEIQVELLDALKIDAFSSCSNEEAVRVVYSINIPVNKYLMG